MKTDVKLDHRPGEPGWLVGKSAGLVIERLRVRIPTRAADELCCPVLTLRADPYSVSASPPPTPLPPPSPPTPVLQQWHVKDSGHSAITAGGRLHLNTYTPLTQPSRSGLAMPLSRHSVGTYPETSSRALCQGTFGHSRFSSLSHCGLILAKRVKLVSAS